MATIREVAERAGASVTTVSHVINETRYVSDEVRLRVLDAMKALNYRPNALARSLRMGQTHTLALILPDSANPFFADIGRAIEDCAFQLGYSVILGNTQGDPRREELYIDVLSKKQVDGIIFVATGEQADSLNLLRSRGLPVVVVNRDLNAVEVDLIYTDNFQGGYLATQHLIQLGHRRIACIAGPSDLTLGADRVDGYRRALEEAGLTYDEGLVLAGDYQPASGFAVTQQLLAGADRPTAIFACNDLMALGALRAAAAAGCPVPAALSVVGFDDIELARYTNPPLTTIAQDKAEIGAQAVRRLVERIGQKDTPYQRAVLPTRLVVRESTGPREGAKPV
jgi:LacI family transcriptional regulator